MLIASDKNQKRIPAWQAERGDDFYCPECQNEVILKAGKIKSAHFAHKPDAIDCPYRLGETELHLRIKREIYEALINYPDCYRCELERRLEGVRPDVSLVIGTSFVAIEIQRSDISIDTIVQRTTHYTQLGIHIIWILPELKLDEEGVCNTKNWHKFLHRLQLGRIYVWESGAIIKPVHLGLYYIWRESYEDYQSGNTYGGYGKQAVSKKYAIVPQGNEQLHIARDFEPMIRSRFTYWPEKRYLSASKLWLDKLGRWWIDEGEEPYE